jgi:cytochrome c peroxidase
MQAAVELGRRLFVDPTASRLGRTSCASCHDPEHGFSDSRAKSEDEDGDDTPRHAPSLVDLGDGPFGWTGEFDTLREAVADEFRDPAHRRDARAGRAVRRYAAAKKADVAVDDRILFDVGVRLRFGDDLGVRTSRRRRAGDAAVASVPSRLGARYAAAFRAAFGDGAVTDDRVVDALAAYVRSLKSGESAYDRYRAGKTDAIPESARRGFDLFVGKAKCATCHVVAGPRPTFTDGAFRATGVGADAHDLGRAAATFVRADAGAFRTPGLRDVARRGPFFHDGSAATLDDVVAFYERGIGAPAVPLGLTESERADLVAFLRSLTGDVAVDVAPLARRATVSVRVERLDGRPDSWAPLLVTPFGRSPAGTPPDAFRVSADENGDARFVFPASTHVVLHCLDERIDAAQPLPDSTTEIVVMAMPEDRVAFRIRRPPDASTAPAQIQVRPRSMDDAPTHESSEAAGRTCPDSSGMTLYASFVRTVGGDDWLYAMGSPGLPIVSRRWIFTAREYGPFDVDLSGGACNAVDLTRAEPDDDRRSDDASPEMRALEEAMLGARAGKGK